MNIPRFVILTLYAISSSLFFGGNANGNQQHQYVKDIVFAINQCGVSGSDLLGSSVVAIADRAAEYLDEKLDNRTKEQKREVIIRVMAELIDDSVDDVKGSYCSRYSTVIETDEFDLVMPNIIESLRDVVHNSIFGDVIVKIFNVFIDITINTTGIDFRRATEVQEVEVPDKERLLPLMLEHAILSVQLINFGVNRAE